MVTNKQSVDLTPQDIAVIESALHTQEKILAMQSRASGDVNATSRLSELKSTLRALRKQTPNGNRQSSWSAMARTLFG